MKRYKLYLLYRQKAKRPFYVGMTKDVKFRFATHCQRMPVKNMKCREVYEVKTISEALRMEAALVHYLRSIGVWVKNNPNCFFTWRDLRRAQNIIIQNIL